MQNNEKIKLGIYDLFFEKNEDAIFIVDEQQNMLLTNHAAQTLTGYEEKEVSALTFQEIFSPLCKKEAIYAYKKASFEQVAPFEAIIVMKNGQEKEVLIEFKRVFMNENDQHVLAILKGITFQKQKESIVNDQNKILEMIAKNEPITRILDNISLLFERIINKNGKCLIFSIDEEKKGKQVISSPNLNKKTLSRFNHLLLTMEHMPPNIAIETKKTVIIEDVRNDKRWKVFQDAASDLDIVSYWSVPFFNAKKEVIGTFDLFFNEKTHVQKEDLKLLKEASFLSGIAIDHYKTREKINHLAFHDPLTDLINRRKLDEVVTDLIQKTKKTKKTFSLLFIDLDRFKMINDTYGHDIGDLFLMEFSRRLRKSIKKTDTIARQGGDEFIILLENTTSEQAKGVAKRIIDLLHKPFSIQGIEIYATPSIGIAVYPNHGETLEELLKVSDDAMYFAKKSGGNDIAIHNPFRKNKSKEKLSMENDLRKALKNNEFELYYQPKFDLQEKKITGVEALIRWNHPKKGVIFPDQFISFAEETGLIIPIGKWILTQACTQLDVWKNTTFKELSISVNLSMRQFFKPELFYVIKEIVEEKNINPSLLELEITETMTMNIETAKTILKKLKKLGITLSIDDFGTGYSSFNYVKHLPIDTIKIDKSFIQDVAISEQSKNIVQIISLIAKTGDFRLIAEGVETKEQLAILEEMTCDQIQGYYISRPLPLQDFETFFRGFTTVSK